MNRMRRHFRREWVIPSLALGLLLLWGCGGESRGPVVLEMQGRSMTLDDLRVEYDLRNKPGDFDRATPEQRQEFLETIADKEILVRAAREALGDLTADEKQRLRMLRENRLFEHLETAVTAQVDADTAGAERIVREKCAKEVRLLHFAGETDSLTNWAREEVVKGRSMEELARTHAIDPMMREMAGQLNWMSGVPLGYDLAEELILDPKPIGYLTEVRRSIRGWEFFKVQEYRDYDLDSNPDIPSMMRATVQQIRHRQTMRAFLDSLKTAHGLKVHEEGGGILHAAMSGYWDSLSASVRQTGQRPTEFHPPRWRVPADQLATPVAQVDGKDISVGEFLEGLAEISPRNWPNAPIYEHFKGHIEARLLAELQFAEAARRGLDRRPEFLAANRQDEEKMLLDRYYEEVVTKGIEITPDEVKQSYEETKDEKYAQREKIRFSYLIFKKESDARSFIREARKHDYQWWGAELKRHQDERPDVTVVSNSPDYDLSADVPEEIQPLVKAGWDHSAGEVVDAVKVPSGWAALRVTYREHDGYIPLERAEQSVRGAILARRVDEKVNETLAAGRESLRLKLYPERLAATQS